MPKVGNKSFPYTAKGIDDAMREKKRLGGKTARKRDSMRSGEPKPSKNVSPYIMPRDAKPAPRRKTGPSVYTLPRKPRKKNQAPIDPSKYYAIDKSRKMK